MKLLESRFLHLQFSAYQSEWRFVLPSGMIRVNGVKDRIKIYAKKVVLRNDVEVINDGNNVLLVDLSPVVIRKGSPHALDLAVELSAKTGLKWRFDPYSGKFMVTNLGAAQKVLSGPMSKILGIDEFIDVPAGQTVWLPKLADLAPPELYVFRLDNLTTNTLDVTEDKVKTSNILLYLGVDVVPFQTKVYTDSSGQFGHWLVRRDLNVLSFSLENSSGEKIFCRSPVTMILAVEIWRDDEGEMLDLQRDLVELARLDLVGKSLENPKK